jgi:hypothetical protein
LGFATIGVAFPWIVGHFNWRFAWYFLGAGALIMAVFYGATFPIYGACAGDYFPKGSWERSSVPGPPSMAGVPY